jgi:two-component system response regulator MprA
VKRVLVVDDEPALRHAFADVLSDAGYEVATASDGRAALETIRAEKPDLVVMDVMMPGLDGVEVSQAIRARPDVPKPFVILMSAGVNRVRLDGAADGFLAKPFDLDELLDLIERLIGPGEADQG